MPTDLSTYLAREVAKDTVKVVAFDREAQRSRFHSGLGPGVRPVRRDVVQLTDAAEASLAKQAAWARSPRGRLVAAIKALEVVGYAHTADRVYACYSRGMADDSREANPAEIGRALTELLSISLNDWPAMEACRAACNALAELLSGKSEAVA